MIDFKERLLFMIGASLTYLSWPMVYNSGIEHSNIVKTTNECCKLIPDLRVCQEQIVKTFGAGISVESLTDLCNATLPNLHYATRSLTCNLVTGIMGTAILVSIVVILSKRIHQNNNH